jgi:hypothetical protein
MDEIKTKLEAELADVRAQIESGKHRAKRAVGDELAASAASSDLRSLRTRLGVLEANRQKLASGVNC